MATPLKTLLVLEAIAKVVLVVKAILLAQSTLLWSQMPNHACIHRSIPVTLARLAKNYTLCGAAGDPPALIYIADWCDSW